MKITQTTLKQLIAEELQSIREAEHEFPSEGLTVEALDEGDQPVVSMTWRNNPGIDVIAQTLVSTYMMSGVVSLRAKEGSESEKWIMSNINGISSKRVRDKVGEAFGLPRFSDDQMDRDRQLGGYGDDDDMMEEKKKGKYDDGDGKDEKCDYVPCKEEG